MKQVLISAFIGSRNMGDEAIFYSILTHLDRDNYEVTAVSVNEKQTKGRFGVKTVLAKRITRLMRAIRRTDLMLVGGGGIIQDQSSILNFFYYGFQLWYAKRHDKPVVLCFVGVGPLKFALSHRILRRVISGVRYAIVRDEASREQLEQAGMDSRLILAAHDPVLNFPLEDTKLQSMSVDQRPYAVISLRRWFFTRPLLPVFVSRALSRLAPFRHRYDSYMTALAKDLDEFLAAQPHLHLVLVSLYDGEDDVVAADLRARMKRQDWVSVAPPKLTEDDYLSIVDGADFVIGMRLHSLILASTLSKPFVALRYSTKVDEFTQQMGLMDHSMHVERYDSAQLQKSLAYVAKHRDALGGIMASTLQEYQVDNKEAFDRLNQTIVRLLAK